MLKIGRFLIITFTLFGCAKGPMGERSKVSFQLPEEYQQKVQSSSQSLATCFAVGVTAPDMENRTPARTCDPSYGAFVGLAPIGRSIEIEVSYGSQRELSIYYVRSDRGCNDFSISKGLGTEFGADRVHRIGQVKDLEIRSAEMTVEVDLEWPHASNTLSQIYEFPEECNRGQAQLHPMAATHARFVQGSARGTTENGSEMHVRLIDQRLKIQAPDSWSGLLLPARLGEEK